MKITTTYLKQVIKEELNKALQENTQEDEDVKGQWGDDREDLVIFPDGSSEIEIQADTGRIYIPKENLNSLISILQEINNNLQEEKPLEEAACRRCGSTPCECPPGTKKQSWDDEVRDAALAAAKFRGKQNAGNKPPPPEEPPR